MPTLEFRCPYEHVTERFYKTVSEGVAVDNIVCPLCSFYDNRIAIAQKTIVSPPLQAHLYGNPEGYHKPSATKRFTTKTVSQREGNDSAVG